MNRLAIYRGPLYRFVAGIWTNLPLKVSQYSTLTGFQSGGLRSAAYPSKTLPAIVTIDCVIMSQK